MPRSKQVVIVGCGPAGLLAAEAASVRGYDPIILGGANPQKSVISGAQYLHHPIPDCTRDQDKFTVKYVKHGTAEGYAAKVYGDPVMAAWTSWNNFPEGEREAWALEPLYDLLWIVYMHKIYPVDFSMKLAEMFLDMGVVKIISTMPLNRLMPWLEFSSEMVLITDQACNPGVGINEIHYYGDDNIAYRSSNINGHVSIEIPRDRSGLVHSLSGWRAVEKPLSFVGSPDRRVSLVGRYGQWQKGVLVDEAYERTLSILRQI